MYAVQSILHPTDFSESSADAFVHARRIAIAAKATLTNVHVASDPDQQEWASFPHVRETLANWGLMKASDSIEAIHAKTGFRIMVPMTQFGTLPDDLVKKSTQMFAQEVAPHLRPS